MLIDRETLSAIANGTVSLAFRRWRRPTVKSGGTLMTAVGQLRVSSVDVVEVDAITELEARAAGFEDLATLRTGLARTREGRIYRIALELAGPDPRIELRERVPEGGDLDELLDRLERWSWAPEALRLIDRRPAVRAADLARRMSMETSRFKANVRRLKGLGLTESLEIGYRLSPRGRAALAALERRET